MADRKIKENASPLGQASLHWLSRAVTARELEPHHPLSLAYWGLENGLQGEWPPDRRYALAQQVHGLLGWDPKAALLWLVSNPEGPDRKEQERELVQSLRLTGMERSMSFGQLRFAILLALLIGVTASPKNLPHVEAALK